MGKAPDWSGLTGTGNGAGGPLPVVGPMDPAERRAAIERLRAMLAGAGPADAGPAADTDLAGHTALAGGTGVAGDTEHAGYAADPHGAPDPPDGAGAGWHPGPPEADSPDGSFRDGPDPGLLEDGPFPDFLGPAAVGAVWGPDPAPQPAGGAGSGGAAGRSAAGATPRTNPRATAGTRGKPRSSHSSRRRTATASGGAASNGSAWEGAAPDGPGDAEPLDGSAGTRRPRKRGAQVPPWAREPVLYEDDAAAEAAARAVVLRLLTGAPKTRRQLEQKLTEKDIPAHVAATVLDRFAEVELIDDAAFAESWVRQRARSKGLARSALRRELGQKGVAEASIDSALEQVDSDQERETAREMVAKKLAGSTGTLDRDKAMRRLVGMLGRKGYPSSLAMGIIREEWDKLHG